VDGAGAGGPAIGAGAPLLERDDALALGDTAIAEARGGHGRAVVIEGPAGIGKSALLWEAVGRGRAAGARVLAARGSEFEREFALGIVRQLFEPAVAGRRAAQRGTLFDGPAAFAESIVVGEPRAAPIDASDAQYAALHALYWLTVHLSGEAPLLLAVDDVQWADDPSLRFLEFLERRLEGLPVLVVVTVRSGEPAVDRAALDALLAGGRAHAIRPAPLSARATAALVETTLPAPPDSGLAEVLHEASKGNPYVLRELLSALRADGARPTAAAARQLTETGAPSVARMTMRRVNGLPAPAIALAEATAVLGERADLPLAVAVAGLGEAVGQSAGRALVDAELLATDAPPRFAHPLIRSAIRGALDPPRLVALHTAAAERLAAAGHVEDAAQHLLDVPPHHEPWVLDTLAEAAAAAAARSGSAVALRLWRRALREPAGPARRSELLLATGAVEAELGRPEAVGTLREALATAPDARARFAASRQLADALLRAGDTVAMVEVLERAIAEVEGVDARLAQELEAQLLLFGPWDIELRPRLASRLGRLGVPRASDGAQPVRLTVAALEALNAARPAAEVAALAGRALSAGALFAQESWTVAAGSAAVNVLARAGRPDEAAAQLERAIARDRSRMAISALRTGVGVRAVIGVLRGDVLAAEADGRAMLELAPEGALGPPSLLAALIEALIERGRPDEAEHELEVAGLAGALPLSMPFNLILYARGRLRVARGLLDAGLADLLECGERCEAAGQRNPAIAPWRSQAAPLLAALGERDRAVALATSECELARRFDAPHVEGPALRALGMVSEGAERLALLRRAVDTLEHSFARLELARALADLGDALRADGQRAPARDALQRAAGLAGALGADALGSRIVEALVDAGGRPRPTRRAADELTPAERRVADVAARGLTNRQAAQELFLSEKTIETHLASTYRKLSIRSRVQLADALARR